MEVTIGSVGAPDYVYLFTDLPDGVNGVAGFREPLSLHSSNGWAYSYSFMNDVIYVTDPLKPQPLLEYSIIAVYRVHAWLSD